MREALDKLEEYINTVVQQDSDHPELSMLREWHTQGESLLVQPKPESLVVARSFHPDQLVGLAEIEFTFSMDVLPVSVGQLWEDKATKPPFGFVNPSQKMRDVVPVARAAAVNYRRFFISGGESLSFVDQQQKLEDYIRIISKKVNEGTLDGVSFEIDHASVYVQLDFESQRRPNGKKLIVGGFARTIDETFVDPTLGPRLAAVGRLFRGNRLYVNDWPRNGGPNVGVGPVASPAGSR